jgi:hypothetical protein
MFIGFGFYNEILNTGPILEPWEIELFAIASMVTGLFSTLLMGAYGYGVVAIVVAIAEMMRWQSMVSNLVMGGASAGFLAFTSFGYLNPVEGTAGPGDNYGVLLVALSAGFIGGFVYWLIAGRKAGIWLQTRARNQLAE